MQRLCPVIKSFHGGKTLSGAVKREVFLRCRCGVMDEWDSHTLFYFDVVVVGLCFVAFVPFSQDVDIFVVE